MTQYIPEAIRRIQYMEELFDALQADLSPDALRVLMQYYESGQWLEDYQLDEQGLLPPGLKRGVLSQDAVYNFLMEISENDDER